MSPTETRGHTYLAEMEVPHGFVGPNRPNIASANLPSILFPASPASCTYPIPYLVQVYPKQSHLVVPLSYRQTHNVRDESTRQIRVTPASSLTPYPSNPRSFPVQLASCTSSNTPSWALANSPRSRTNITRHRFRVVRFLYILPSHKVLPARLRIWCSPGPNTPSWAIANSQQSFLLGYASSSFRFPEQSSFRTR